MHTDAKRYYAVLGIDQSASEEVIRSAFRRRAKELHPDSPSGDAGAFILLKRAYDTLLNANDRAAYDLANQPPPRQPAPRPWAAEPRRSSSQRSPSQRSRPFSPPPPVSPPSRRGGVGFVRYAVAFLIMAAISLGGVQAMISLTEAPPSIQTRSITARAETSPDTAPSPAAEPSTAPGSSKSGFWDPTPTATSKKSP